MTIARTQLTFVAGVEAALDEVCRLGRVAPSVLSLVVAELIELGEGTGELAGADRLIVADTITTMFESLGQIHAVLPTAQAGAVEGYKRLLAGTLVRSAAPE